MGSSGTPDMSLINDLYEAIDTHPPAIEARRLLMQHYVEVGWFDAAADTAKEILELVPTDKDALSISAKYKKKDASVGSLSQAALPRSQRPLVKPVPVPKIENVDSAMQDLAQGCKLLMIHANKLQQEIDLLRNNEVLRDMQSADGQIERKLAALNALTKGRLSTTWDSRRPQAARGVALAVVAAPANAVVTIIENLVSMIDWLEAQNLSKDELQEAIVKRARAIQDALPEALRPRAKQALCHVEHENLKRKYVNDETMLGDQIDEIPRTNFFVSEDGYAWDMDELAQAIRSKDGVMRNPLSLQMFSVDDIRAIIGHPLGKGLAALHVTQGKLSKGVRQGTIMQLEKLAKMLLEDQSTDQIPSHKAMEEFLAYVATLPTSEQDSLEKLQVPARDSLNGRPFDTKILESVRDAKGNRTCTHKTGDFLNQAASFLAKKK